MNIYMKNYAHRAKEITAAVLIVCVAIIAVTLLFGAKLRAISDQLASYANSQYQYAYVLNYDVDSDEVYLYPDVDVMLFTDENQTNRMTVSSLMWKNTGEHSILGINDISADEIAVSRNTADNYRLHVGDKVYAVYSFSSKPYELTVKEISGTEYDYTSPKIDNDIGMVYLPYSNEYADSINSKYVLFSEMSASDLLPPYPQIIESIIRKNSNYEEVMKQGIHIIFFEVVFVIAATWISHILFFRKSIPILRRFFLKGANKQILIMEPFLENLVFSLVPVMIVCLITSRFIPCNSVLTKLYYCVPIGLSSIYAIGTCIMACVSYRRRR